MCTGTVSRDGIFFIVGLYILKVVFVYALIVFKVFQKLFTILYSYQRLFASLKLLTHFENA
jgi:hypothetical protein